MLVEAQIEHIARQIEQQIDQAVVKTAFRQDRALAACTLGFSVSVRAFQATHQCEAVVRDEAV